MNLLFRITICPVIIFMFSLQAAAECKSELIGVTVYFYSQGKEFSTTWQADGAHKRKTDYNANRKEGYRTNAHDSRGNERSERLPQTLVSPDKQFNVPFDISPNGELLIAAIHRKTHTLMSLSNQLAIVSLKEQKVTKIIEAEYGIRSLAWAPDGKYFAVLYAQDVTKQVFKGPLDWLAEYLGHGNYYWTFHLTLYQPDGTLVCTEQVEKKLPNAMSYVDWEKQ